MWVEVAESAQPDLSIRIISETQPIAWLLWPGVAGVSFVT